MDILINTLLVGFAVAYLVELISSTVESLFSPRILKMVLTLPLSVLGCWYMDIYGFKLVVCGAAAAFISLAVLKLASKPAIIQNVSNRRY
jgi:sensor histidine kinase regulating citrate/malate metabolism